MQNNNLLNQVIDDIKSSKMEEDKGNEYITISIRPGYKIASLIEVFLKLTNKKISSLLTDNISTELYEYVVQNKHYGKAIENTCKKLAAEDIYYIYPIERFNDDSLSLLVKNKCLSVKGIFDKSPF